MIKAGDKKEVSIIDINYMGQGVAKSEDLVIFVDGAITGDCVEIEIKEVKKSFAVGKMLRIITKSDKRVSPQCEYFPRCGGCQIMGLRYDEQLIYKKNRVANELKRGKIDFDCNQIKDTIGMETPFRYRNKTAFSVQSKNNEIIIGPYEQSSYNVVDVKSCMLQNEKADEILKLFKELMVKYKAKPYDAKKGTGIVKNIIIRSNQIGELMVIIVTSSANLSGSKSMAKEMAAKIKEIKTVVQNIKGRNTNVIMGDRNLILYGDGMISDTVGDLKFDISPETFFQINSIQAEKLYETVMEYSDIKKSDVCFDIYCGIGTISLMAAQKAKKVYGIEISEQSIVNAKVNAEMNNINNVEFHTGNAEILFPELCKQGVKADVVIVDPPRKGCETEVIDTIINMSPNKVVYVSCNPATLVRDIKLLESGGYKLKTVQPIDMFCNSAHVECVVLMTRNSK